MQNGEAHVKATASVRYLGSSAFSRASEPTAVTGKVAVKEWCKDHRVRAARWGCVPLGWIDRVRLSMLGHGRQLGSSEMNQAASGQDRTIPSPASPGSRTRRRMPTAMPWGWASVLSPELRRDRPPGAERALGIDLTPVQEQALCLALSRGEVRRGALVSRCGISRESARKALLGLVRTGAVQREGSGAGCGTC